MVVASVMVLIMAIMGQTLLELYGNATPVLHVNKLFNRQNDISLNGFRSDPTPEDLAAFWGRLGITRLEPEGRSVVLHEEQEEVRAAVHDQETHGEAVAWDKLSPKQRRMWKTRLQGRRPLGRAHGRGRIPGHHVWPAGRGRQPRS